MRLIDADRLKVVLEKNFGHTGGASVLEQLIDEQPTVEPEIIHCRNCKHWREHKYAKETKRYIPFCGFNAIYTKADDFCSKAERRTDEE